jgi:hypothetical protein
MASDAFRDATSTESQRVDHDSEKETSANDVSELLRLQQQAAHDESPRSVHGFRVGFFYFRLFPV